MYTYLDSLESPSLVDDDVILEMEKALNAWLKKAEKEGWEGTDYDNLLDGATNASSLAWSIHNETNKRPQDFFISINALKTTLDLLRKD